LEIGKRFPTKPIIPETIGNGKSLAPSSNDDGHEISEARDDPHRLARLYLHSQRHGCRDTIHFWRGEFYYWDGTAYCTKTEEEVRGYLTAAIKKEFDRLTREETAEWKATQPKDAKGRPLPQPVSRKVTTNLVANVLQALASMTLLDNNIPQPSWIKPLPPILPLPAAEMLACKNGLVHLPSVLEGRGRLLSPTPQFFSANAFDYDFDLTAPQPKRWLRFLKQIWPDDRQSIDALQDWFGYCLLPDTSQQKILLMIGPKRSGRGTISRVLRALVCPANVASCSLASLGGSFGLQALLGKTLAVIADARLSGRANLEMIAERLLNISGEDAVPVERKFLTTIHTSLSVRFMILSNELPHLTDASGALPSRFIVLRFTNSWYGQEDPDLTNKLLVEVPGILLWALEGLKRLRERRRFVQPESALDLIRALEDLSSPTKTWLKERCNVDPKLKGEPDAMFRDWCQWCEDNGIKDAGAKSVFSRNIHAAVPGLRVEQPRLPGSKGKRVRYWVGVRLKTS
jgi:putative DNA primase/helicase